MHSRSELVICSPVIEPVIKDILDCYFEDFQNVFIVKLEHMQYIACFFHCIECILAIKAQNIFKKNIIDLHIQDTAHKRLKKKVLTSGNVAFQESHLCLFFLPEKQH